jgi:hypothetical protein
VDGALRAAWESKTPQAQINVGGANAERFRTSEDGDEI